MATPAFGIKFTSVAEEIRTVILSNMSVIGLVGTAPGADAITYPLNKPVLLNSNDTVELAKLGITGTLSSDIRAINNQLGANQSAATVIVVRVNEGLNVAERCANLLGTQAAKTGAWALLEAGATVGLTPRLIGVSSVTASRDLAVIALVNGLNPILEKLRAHAVVDAASVSYADYIAWRNQISSKRIIPVAPSLREMVGSAETSRGAAAAVLGLAVKTDHEYDGVPARSWANQVIQGIVGTARPITFSLTDGDCEGQQILTANGGIVVRGGVGVENSISDGGFTYIGTDNLGNDDVWRFYNQVRMRDYIELIFLRTLRYYLGRSNVTAQTLTNIKMTMENILAPMKARGYLLGFEVNIPGNWNSIDELRNGTVTYQFNAEEPAPLRVIGVRSARHRPAVTALMGELINQMNA